MLYVAICDDEERVCTELEDMLTHILERQNIQYELDLYSGSEELCAKIENGFHYNIIFLDIEYSKNTLNGVAVGKMIRETHHNDLTAIVFISWEMKYSMQLFDIRPLNFLVKPLQFAKVEQCMATYLRIEGLWAGEFVYKIGHSIHKVLVKDIVYIQSEKRKLVLHLSDGREEIFYGMLKNIYQEQLHRFDFIFIHGSCVVNYDYIAVAKYDEMLLIDGSTLLSISQPKRKEVREKYHEITERRGI